MNKRSVIVGLGYGDEGKGTITDYLIRKNDASVVVRFNGGPQAAHHVVMPDGRMHCFSQFGSGTFVSNVKTYLSRYMIVDPLAMKLENESLMANGISDGLERLIVDRDCLMVTPFHKIIGRMMEIMRGKNRHGSCGKGIGRAVEDGKMLGSKALRIGDLIDARTMKEKLNFLWRVKIDQAEQLLDEQPADKQLAEYFVQMNRVEYPKLLAEAYQEFVESGVSIADDVTGREILNQKNIILEGAQGALLDAERGFLPYVTSTRTTIANAKALFGDVEQSNMFKRIGVLRAYATRHGVGPFVTEDFQLMKIMPDMHNGSNEWQGPFRIGWLDLLTARYSIEINGGIDEIALTNLDRLSCLGKIKVCGSYEYVGTKNDLLEKYFRVEKIRNGKTKISGIRTDFKDKFSQEQLTRLLIDCQPLDIIEFSGWKKDLASIEKFVDLPQEAKILIDFLVSERGLNVPISIVSKGPTWADKVITPSF